MLPCINIMSEGANASEDKVIYCTPRICGEMEGEWYVTIQASIEVQAYIV
jgi:hypothetical protein